MEQEIRLREIRLTEIRQEPDRKGFDLAKQVRLVPKFVEANIDEYFPHFEITAANMNWPREIWAMLLQTALTGKTQKAYTTLSAEDCKNYDTVKKTILQSFELGAGGISTEVPKPKKKREPVVHGICQRKRTTNEQVVCCKNDRRGCGKIEATHPYWRNIKLGARGNENLPK